MAGRVRPATLYYSFFSHGSPFLFRKLRPWYHFYTITSLLFSFSPPPPPFSSCPGVVVIIIIVPPVQLCCQSIPLRPRATPSPRPPLERLHEPGGPAWRHTSPFLSHAKARRRRLYHFKFPEKVARFPRALRSTVYWFSQRIIHARFFNPHHPPNGHAYIWCHGKGANISVHTRV